ncbi:MULTISPECIES: hypothetical protein [Pseudoalteromonas]|uniref:hypothetical protein n=1 Tax=Pseudoalteromonas TaxID=53246 RepID=UPI0002315E88|nr:hypothetical protein [Pseudoalteromonas sp. BSi20495]GAA78330.1 hypothetical protein P20495_0821 [Pseudoalteromonas sp. BSi20495]
MRIILTLLLFITFSSKAMDTRGYYQISQIYSWGDYVQGTFKIILKSQNESTQSVCPAGFWLDGANDKNSAMYSTALAAYHSNTKVKIYADESQDWSGLSSKECKLKLIVLEPK